jgi:hypothetical protein
VKGVSHNRIITVQCQVKEAQQEPQPSAQQAHSVLLMAEVGKLFADKAFAFPKPLLD